ncbi:MAG: hypothetical protein RBT47_09875 [Anaerolineae bacterium]|jgi:hypothetical protein|nr:hypothetical protein [Anaerolineae bacterium]
MARKRTYTTRQTLRLQGVERILVIFGATLYLIGLLGGLGLLPMPEFTAILLLALGGGMLLIVTLRLVF